MDFIIQRLILFINLIEYVVNKPNHEIDFGKIMEKIFGKDKVSVSSHFNVLYEDKHLYFRGYTNFQKIQLLQ